MNKALEARLSPWSDLCSQQAYGESRIETMEEKPTKMVICKETLD